MPLILIAGLVPVFGYWAALELFLDDANLVGWQIAIALAAVAGSWLVQLVPFADLLRGAAVITLFGHLLYVILTSGAGDLVEERRQFRTWFLLVLVAVVIITTMLEITGQDRNLPPWAFAAQAASILSLAMCFLVWAVRPITAVWAAKPDRWAGQSTRLRADDILADRAKAAMEAGLWQEEGLTISQLAHRLDTQEHRLRRAINSGLGFRNFPSFVNQYRIEAAKSLLTNPDKAGHPVQTIAYEVGFSSIGPFNRAFRASEGMSPTEFRNHFLMESA